jgi:hypothetical protein
MGNEGGPAVRIYRENLTSQVHTGYGQQKGVGRQNKSRESGSCSTYILWVTKGSWWSEWVEEFGEPKYAPTMSKERELVVSID